MTAFPPSGCSTVTEVTGSLPDVLPGGPVVEHKELTELKCNVPPVGSKWDSDSCVSLATTSALLPTSIFW